MKRIIASLLLVLATWWAAMAVPAKPGYYTFTQSDGTQITVQKVGDEFFHLYVTQDGLPVDMDERGDLHYVTPQGVSSGLAHDPSGRTADELSFIASMPSVASPADLEPAGARAKRAAARSPRKVGQTQVPTMGSPRVPIILVQYTDKQMVNTVEQFEAHYKTDPKSVLQYFTDQSNGKYTPQYDMYGIYDLPSSRATYGGNDSQGNDKGVALMVCDAIDKAGGDIDWSQYDNDGDGEADVCIVVYAGPGEAQSSVREAVWPCQWSLSAGQYYGDGTGARHRNGVTIDRFAVFNETYGSSDNGTMLDGIGVFCHEFSHCLGLPDFYCTTYASGRPGMGGWSLMNSGCYNGGAISGDTPIGYSAYEKNFMDWIDYIEPEEDTHYTLPVFNAKSLESDQAIKIVSDLNENEYFILENRRKQGWDQYIADEGVLITHFTYVPDRWESNTVNNEVLQLATVMAADNNFGGNSESTDLFGQTNHAFTSTSKPAMKLNMRANGSLASSTGGAGTLDKPVTDIVLNSDGTASLWYVKAPDPELIVPRTSLTLSAQAGKTETTTLNIQGIALPNNVLLTLNDEAGVFSIDKSEMTATEAQAGQLVTITFAPQAVTSYSASITVACQGVDTVTVSLTGQGRIVTETPVMLAADPSWVTATSFRADWTDATPVANVKSYNLYAYYVRRADLTELPHLVDFGHLSAVTNGGSVPMLKDLGGAAASEYLPAGWAATSPFYVTNGAILLGDSLTTDTYEVPVKKDKISVVVSGRSYNTNTYGRATLEVTATGSEARQTQTFGSIISSYTYVLDASPVESLVLKGTNYPSISSICIYAGDITADAQAPLLAVVEQGDEWDRAIEGITDTHYVVENLVAGGSYRYKVETVYVDDTRSVMSNVQFVTLLGARGDVNADGMVDISDVNILIDIMLGKSLTPDPSPEGEGRCDVTGDGVVDIADVNAVIDIMLGKH